MLGSVIVLALLVCPLLFFPRAYTQPIDPFYGTPNPDYSPPTNDPQTTPAKTNIPPRKPASPPLAKNAPTQPKIRSTFPFPAPTAPSGRRTPPIPASPTLNSLSPENPLKRQSLTKNTQPASAPQPLAALEEELEKISGIAKSLARQFDSQRDAETPLPETDFFQGDLGEAYSAFTKIPYIADKTIAGWRDFTLNMPYPAVTNLIKSSQYPWLTLKGDFQPLFTPEDSIFFIETYANTYFQTIQFFFDKEQLLYMIRLKPLPAYFSFNDLLTQFHKKYGQSDFLDITKVVWISTEGTHLELKRNSTLRYIRANIIKDNALVKDAPLNTASPIEQDKNVFKTNLLDTF